MWMDLGVCPKLYIQNLNLLLFDLIKMIRTVVFVILFHYSLGHLLPSVNISVVQIPSPDLLLVVTAASLVSDFCKCNVTWEIKFIHMCKILKNLLQLAYAHQIGSHFPLPRATATTSCTVYQRE